MAELFCTMSSNGSSPTNGARPLALRGNVIVEVSLWALGLRSLIGGMSFSRGGIPFPTAYIFQIADWLQVIWIYTATYSTKVVNLQAVRYWSFQQFISNAVSKFCNLSNLDAAVATLEQGEHPNPTTGLGDGHIVFQKTFENGKMRLGHAIPPRISSVWVTRRATATVTLFYFIPETS